MSKYELPEEILAGELIYIHGIHDKSSYSWGWAVVVDGPSRGFTKDKLVKVWKVLFRGKLVQLRLEEFTRFAWYNRHLIHEDDPTTPKKMVS